MTISRRLMITMIISAVATLFITVLNFTQMDRVFREANFGNEGVVPSITILDTALLEFGHIRVRLYRHALTEDVKVKDDLAAAISESERLFVKALKDYESFVHSGDDKRFLDEDAKLFSAYMTRVRDIVALSRAGKEDETLQRLVEGVRIAEELNDSLQKHMALNKTLGEQSAARALQHGFRSPYRWCRYSSSWA